MMRCIRIEHPKSKKGIFRHSSIHDINPCDDMPRTRMKFRDFPTPGSDTGICDYTFYGGGFVCAFKNIAQFRQFVDLDEFKKVIKTWKMRIYEIRVLKTVKGKRTVMEGEYQIVYNPKAVYRKKDITSLFLN